MNKPKNWATIETLDAINSRTMKVIYQMFMFQISRFFPWNSLMCTDWLSLWVNNLPKLPLPQPQLVGQTSIRKLDIWKWTYFLLIWFQILDCMEPSYLMLLCTDQVSVRVNNLCTIQPRLVEQANIRTLDIWKYMYILILDFRLYWTLSCCCVPTIGPGVSSS